MFLAIAALMVTIPQNVTILHSIFLFKISLERNSKSVTIFYTLDFHFRRMKENPVEHVRDILVQEIMNIESSEFEKEAIDMDAISFASK